jgi:hypothetical protein
MVTTNNFSEGMIINHQSDSVSLCHCVFNGMMGWCVSLQDLKSFLAKQKVLSTIAKHVTKGF